MEESERYRSMNVENIDFVLDECVTNVGVENVPVPITTKNNVIINRAVSLVILILQNQPRTVQPTLGKNLAVLGQRGLTGVHALGHVPAGLLISDGNV